MTFQIIEVPIVSEAIRRMGAPTSPLVRFGDLLQTCGMPPIDLATGDLATGTIEAQMHASLKALEWTLAQAGASLKDVVKATLYITDASLLARANAVYASYFTPPFPARTSVVAMPWPGDFAVEIECLAVHPA